MFGMYTTLKGIPISCPDSACTRNHRYHQVCAVEHARRPSEKASAFVALGNAMGYCETATVTVSVDMTRKECYLAAIALDPRNSSAYSNLGASMNRWENVKLNDKWMYQKDCHLMAIDLDPRNPVAYINLARFIEGSITLSNGTVMTQRDCYLAAIDCDPHDSETYHSLSGTMRADEKVTLRNGTVMTKKDCYLAAIDCDPHDYRAYRSLSGTMGVDEKVTLRNGTVMTKKDCYFAAIDCTPYYSRAYSNELKKRWLDDEGKE